MKPFALVAVLLFASTAAAGCRDVELASSPKTRPITIDGTVSEWSDVDFVEKDDLFFGLVNDDTCLYVAVIARDMPLRRQLMISGLYLWFDETGGKNKNFGVCFPTGGMEDAGVRMGPPGPRRGDGMSGPTGDAESSGTPPPGPPPSLFRTVMVFSLKSGDWAQDEHGSLGGVEAAGRLGRQAITLEIKIPLGRDAATGYGIGVAPGQTVGVGIESPEIKNREIGPPDGSGDGGMSAPGGGGGPGGGPGGMGGRPGSPGPGGAGGGTGEPGGGAQRERPEPVKVWGKLTFAALDGRVD